MLKKKSLGQHFLNSPKIIADIVSTGKVKRGDVVIEIGPGEGVLTSELLKTGAHVITVEKDDRLIPVLHEKFAKEISSNQLELIHADILSYNLSEVTKKTYKVVANIPYYITGQLIRLFLESDKQPESMTLLVQKEVAERIVARDGKESLLSLSVKVYGEPKLVRTVGRGAFNPQPNVDSAVLFIENISKGNFPQVGPIEIKGPSEELFFKVIHAGFAHKRKQLLPNLSDINKKEILVDAFKKTGLNIKCRAEDVPLNKWLELCGAL